MNASELHKNFLSLAIIEATSARTVLGKLFRYPSNEPIATQYPYRIPDPIRRTSFPKSSGGSLNTKNLQVHIALAPAQTHHPGTLKSAGNAVALRGLPLNRNEPRSRI